MLVSINDGIAEFDAEGRMTIDCYAWGNMIVVFRVNTGDVF